MFGKVFAVVAATIAFAAGTAHAETVGVTESEIKIGATFPFTGPPSKNRSWWRTGRARPNGGDAAPYGLS